MSHPGFTDCDTDWDDPYTDDHVHTCDLTASHTGFHACDCGAHWCRDTECTGCDDEDCDR